MPNNDEQDFRERLYDYESPVDPADVWAAIQGDLQPPPKKKRSWWWLPVLMLLIGGIGFGITSLGNGAGTRVPKKVEERGIPTPRPMAAERTNDNTTAGQPLPPNATKPIARTEEPRPDQSTQTARVDGAAPQAPGIPPLTNANTAGTINPDAAEETGARSGQPTRSPRTDGAPPRPQTPGSPPPANTETADAAETYASVETDAENTDEDTTAGERKPRPYGRIARLPTKESITLLSFSDDALALPNMDLGSPPANSFTAQPHPGFSLGLYAGVSAIDQRFSAESSAERLDLYNGMDKLEAVTADLDLGYRTRRGWTVRGGLSYARLNYAAGAVTVTRADTMQEGIVQLNILDGDTTAVTGLVNGSEITTRTQRYYNHLTVIDLPILLGKRFRRGRFHADLLAGPVFNLAVRDNARLPLGNDTFGERTVTTDRFAPPLGLGWRGQASVGYQLGNGFEISAGLRYQDHGLRTRNVGDLQLGARHRTVGGSIGIRKAL